MPSLPPSPTYSEFIPMQIFLRPVSIHQPGQTIPLDYRLLFITISLLSHLGCADSWLFIGLEAMRGVGVDTGKNQHHLLKHLLQVKPVPGIQARWAVLWQMGKSKESGSFKFSGSPLQMSPFHVSMSHSIRAWFSHKRPVHITRIKVCFPEITLYN